MSKVIVGALIILVYLLLPAWTQLSKIDLPQEGDIMLLQGNSLATSHPALFGNEKEVWSAVWEANHKYPEISFDLLYRLGQCESGLRHNKFGDNGKAFGLYQWHQSSWDMYNKKFGTDLDRKNIYDQAIMTSRVLLESNGWKNWQNCFKKQTLGDLF